MKSIEIITRRLCLKPLGAEALVTYFIDNMKTTHFIAHCDTENVASYRVMEKLGMVKTGKWGGRRNKKVNDGRGKI